MMKINNLFILLLTNVVSSSSAWSDSVPHLLHDAHQLMHEKKSVNAITLFQQVLALEPQNFEAHFQLGTLFFGQEQFEQAVYHYHKAAQLQPHNATITHNLIIANKRMGKNVDSLIHSIAENKTHENNQLLTAREYEKQGKLELAEKHYRNALTCNPTNMQTARQLAELLKRNNKHEQAIEYFEKVCDAQPNDIAALFSYAGNLLHVGNIEKAISLYKQIVTLKPETLSALYNMGYALKVAGQNDRAIEIYNQVLEKDPEYGAAHLARGFAYISKGDFENGWKYHSWHLKKMGKNSDKLRELLATNSIAGKTILLLPEGGLGDSIMFIRYARRLKEMGAKVVVICQKILHNLFHSIEYIDQLIVSGSGTSTAHDARATLMSLPAIFNDSEQDIIKNSATYMHPQKDLIDQWKQIIDTNKNKLKIGLCWAADVFNDSSRLPIARRGIPLAQLTKLQNNEHIAFYSLQKKEGLDELNQLPISFEIETFGHDFDEQNGPFIDSAAIIDNLDLVITIDSAVAHLAGALGKPVFLLLPYSTDWRWIVNRSDSPWYPTMRIFKQPAPFDWDSVIKEVQLALDKLVRNK